METISNDISDVKQYLTPSIKVTSVTISLLKIASSLFRLSYCFCGVLTILQCILVVNIFPQCEGSFRRMDSSTGMLLENEFVLQIIEADIS